MKTIKEYMEKKPGKTMTSVEIERELFKKLKDKLKKEGQSLTTFFSASAEKYLSEK